MSGTPAWSVSGGQAEISDDNDTFASNMAARVAPGTCCGGTGCRRWCAGPVFILLEFYYTIKYFYLSIFVSQNV